MGDDPLHHWAFDRRQRMDAGRSPIWVAPIEYVILRKLEYHAASGWERHLPDVAMMLRISGDVVDAPALEAWVAERGLSRVLELARSYPARER